MKRPFQEIPEPLIVGSSRLLRSPAGARAPSMRHAPQARFFLSLVLIGAAMPISVAQGVPVIGTIRVLDVLLMLAALSLLLDMSFRPLDVGYKQIYWILMLPLLLTLLSALWSQDRAATARSILMYSEGLVAYLFVVRELGAASAPRIVSYIERYVYLLIIPSVLLLLHVPGFEPTLPDDVSETSGDYLKYFTRLSHPILGSSNNLAAVLAIVAPVLVYWGVTRSDRRSYLAGVAGTVAIFLTLSRGTLLSFVIAAVIYGAFIGTSSRVVFNRFLPRIVRLATLGVIGIALLYLFNAETRELIATRLSWSNITGRLELLTNAWQKIEQHPVLGYGGGVAPDGDALLGEGVHNTFLQQMLYFGIPLGFFLSVALCGLVGFFAAYRKRVAIAGVAAYVLLVELVSFLFESSFEGTILRVLFYMSVGFLVTLVRAEERDAGAGSARRMRRSIQVVSS